MKAYLYKDNNLPLEKCQIKKPVLPDSGAIIKVSGCGLCGSDIVKYRQGLANPGTVFGHEVVGIIEEIKTKTGFKVGDKIVLGHHVPCYDCVFCKNENYPMCREFKASNIIPGGFCEYIYVSEKHLEDTVQKIPEKMSDIRASFTEPAACCLRAVRRLNIKKDDIVMVIGLGSVGIIAGQILKHFGAKVVGCDIIEERVKFAENSGFDKAYKYVSDEETAELCRADFQKEGVDKVFLAAGNAKTISLALKCVRDGGVICVFASVNSRDAGKNSGNDTVVREDGCLRGFFNNEIYYRDLTVFGSYSPASSDLKEALNLIEKTVIKPDRFVAEYNFDEINNAIDDTVSNKIMKAYINI